MKIKVTQKVTREVELTITPAEWATLKLREGQPSFHTYRAEVAEDIMGRARAALEHPDTVTIYGEIVLEDSNTELHSVPQ